MKSQNMGPALDEMSKLGLTEQYSIMNMIIRSWRGEEGKKCREMLERTLIRVKERDKFLKAQDPMAHPGLSSFK